MNKLTRRLDEALKGEILYYLTPDRPKKILFDHLPKCGGSTLKAYLLKHYPRRKSFLTNGWDPHKSIQEFKEMPQSSRHDYCLIQGHLANQLIGDADPACLKVTLLRDPVERIISHYFFVKRTQKHYLHRTIHDSNISLEDYACSNLSDELKNWYTTHFSGFTSVKAEKNPEEAVATAVETVLNQFDIIGFLDDFPAFIESLRKRANLRYAYNDDRVNVTVDRPSTANIPSSTIKLIEQKNEMDIAFYHKLRERLPHPERCST